MRRLGLMMQDGADKAPRMRDAPPLPSRRSSVGTDHNHGSGTRQPCSWRFHRAARHTRQPGPVHTPYAQANAVMTCGIRTGVTVPP